MPDENVDELVIKSLVSDLIELTISPELRPPIFKINLNEIKEIIKRLIK